MNQPIDPRALIRAAQDLAAASRDIAGPAMLNNITVGALSAGIRDQQRITALYRESITAHMNLVMDCFLTGAAMCLKILHGDDSQEPWANDYDHEERLGELLRQYQLLKES